MGRYTVAGRFSTALVRRCHKRSETAAAHGAPAHLDPKALTKLGRCQHRKPGRKGTQIAAPCYQPVSVGIGCEQQRQHWVIRCVADRRRVQLLMWQDIGKHCQSVDKVGHLPIMMTSMVSTVAALSESRLRGSG